MQNDHAMGAEPGTVFHGQEANPASGTLYMPHRFAGRQWDAESDLYYYRSRYYDPSLGRFISLDTIGIWGDLNNYGNGYAYVGNMGNRFLDPGGSDVRLVKVKVQTNTAVERTVLYIYHTTDFSVSSEDSCEDIEFQRDFVGPARQALQQAGAEVGISVHYHARIVAAGQPGNTDEDRIEVHPTSVDPYAHGHFDRHEGFLSGIVRLFRRMRSTTYIHELFWHRATGRRDHPPWGVGNPGSSIEAIDILYLLQLAEEQEENTPSTTGENPDHMPAPDNHFFYSSKEDIQLLSATGRIKAAPKKQRDICEYRYEIQKRRFSPRTYPRTDGRGRIVYRNYYRNSTINWEGRMGLLPRNRIGVIDPVR
jgi:RHS repeat-associated protein